MNQQTKPKLARTQRSEPEILDLLDEYEANKDNMSLGEFCELYEISDSTFYNWQKKYRKSTSGIKNTFVQFSPSSISGSQEIPGSSFASFMLPNGQPFYIHHYVEPAYLKALLNLEGL